MMIKRLNKTGPLSHAAAGKKMLLPVSLSLLLAITMITVSGVPAAAETGTAGPPAAESSAAAAEVISPLTETAHTFDAAGFCTGCGAYQPAVEADGVYEISNAGQLYWFAALVNGGNTAAGGRLTGNITDNTGILNGSNYSLGTSYTSCRRWTPIGTAGYTGTFDGGGYTINGLYNNDTTLSAAGLFGILNGAVIRDVSVADTYFKGGDITGGLCGKSTGSTIRGCSFSGVLRSSGSWGGLCGLLSGGSIVNCTAAGVLLGTGENPGGICGIAEAGSSITNCSSSMDNESGSVSGPGGICSTNAGSIANCFNTGEMNGDTLISGICGTNTGTIANCFNTGALDADTTAGICGSNTGTITACYYLTGADSGIGGQTDVSGTAAAKGRSAFASGEVCYLLNGSTSEGSPVWRQTIGSQNLPSFSESIVCYDASRSSPYYNETAVASISIDISWGQLAFTYQGESRGTWNPETLSYDNVTEGSWQPSSAAGNRITVQNSGTTAVQISAAYTPDVSEITGALTTAGGTAFTEASLGTGTQLSIFLTLSGRPSADLTSAPLGQVTVRVQTESTAPGKSGLVQNADGSYSYYGAGSPMTGWIQDPASGLWYFGNERGILQTGFITYNGSRFYLDPPVGVMHTGLLTIGTDKYYALPNNGRLASGWVSIDNKWYYFYSDTNLMAHDTTIDGYQLGSDGAWIQ